MAEIVQLLASPVHRYEGRPADGPAAAPPGELVEQVEIRAGAGIVGDRYYGHPAHRDSAITVIAEESLPPGADLTQVRRNILLRGVAVDDLVARDSASGPRPPGGEVHGVGSVLVLDSGAGPVRLRVHRPANPCAWMDATIGPGAMRALRGHGGIRCVPLNDGTLHIGPIEVRIEAAPD